MRKRVLRAVPAAITLALLAGSAHAQYVPPGAIQRPDPTNNTGLKFKIKRRSVSGTVKAVDPDKRTLVLASTQGAKDVPVDASLGEIKAGKGSAKVADIRTGDKITVYGEVTVQGGLRAMEITLPPSRMTVPPAPKVKKQKVKKGETVVKLGADGKPITDEDSRPSKKSKKSKKAKKPKQQPAPTTTIPDSNTPTPDTTTPPSTGTTPDSGTPAPGTPAPSNPSGTGTGTPSTPGTGGQ